MAQLTSNHTEFCIQELQKTEAKIKQGFASIQMQYSNFEVALENILKPIAFI